MRKTAGAPPLAQDRREFMRAGGVATVQSAIERGGNEAVAVSLVERALDLGVNYIDTSSIYGGPERWSERCIGQVMKRRRAEAFLASKTKERSRDGSLRMLEQSLKLLNTDHLDLWQLHDVGTAGGAPGTLAMREAMAYALSLPVSTVIVGCDSAAQLEENVCLAREFTPLSAAQMVTLAEKAAPCAKQALFFPFFDRA